MRFWIQRVPGSKEERYAVDVCGVTRFFTDVESLTEAREQLSTRRIIVRQYLFEPIWTWVKGTHYINNPLLALRFHIHETYLFLRHRKRAIELYEKAYDHFKRDKQSFGNRTAEDERLT